MAQRTTRKKLLKEDDFVEKATDIGQWLEENWTVVVKAAAGVLLLAVIVAVWFWYADRNATQARLSLSAGLKLFETAEKEEYANPALLEQSIERFDAAIKKGGGETARAASYYRAVALLHQGRSTDAAAALEVLARGKKADTLSGAAGALLADLYVEEGRAEEAISLLEGLAAKEDSAYPPDQVLFQLAGIHEARGELEAARAVWQRIVDEFPTTQTAIDARQRLNT